MSSTRDDASITRRYPPVSGAEITRAWRRLHVRGYRSPRRWRQGAQDLVAWSVGLAVDAARAVRRYGAGVRERDGVGLVRQWLATWTLGLRWSFKSEDVYRLRLYEPSRRRRASDYLAATVSYRLLLHLNRHALHFPRERLADKARFADWCREQGLPTAPVLAAFADGEMRPARVDLPPDDLFTKSVEGYGGYGARLWRRGDDGRWSADDEGPFDAEALLERLRGSSTGGSLILQRRLRTHPALADLTTGALCTIRVRTLRFPDGTVVWNGQVLRMPVGGMIVDNISSGGIASSIDLDTGRLGPARHGDPSRAHELVHAHPDTGARIEGRAIPMWGDVLEIARRAHELSTDIPAMGWDVALTTDGLILLEGNTLPGIQVGQMFWGPYGGTEYTACLAAHLAAVEARARSGRGQH